MGRLSELSRAISPVSCLELVLHICVSRLVKPFFRPPLCVGRSYTDQVGVVFVSKAMANVSTAFRLSRPKAPSCVTRHGPLVLPPKLFDRCYPPRSRWGLVIGRTTASA